MSTVYYKVTIKGLKGLRDNSVSGLCGSSGCFVCDCWGFDKKFPICFIFTFFGCDSVLFNESLTDVGVLALASFVMVSD